MKNSTFLVKQTQAYVLRILENIHLAAGIVDQAQYETTKKQIMKIKDIEELHAIEDRLYEIEDESKKIHTLDVII